MVKPDAMRCNSYRGLHGVSNEGKYGKVLHIAEMPDVWVHGLPPLTIPDVTKEYSNTLSDSVDRREGTKVHSH